MKKLMIIFTITAALFVGAINGANVPGTYTDVEDLPTEIQVMLVQALHTYDKLPDIITALKAFSQTNSQFNAIINDVYFNPKGFNTLLQILARKFVQDPEVIAAQFGTKTSQKYLKLVSLNEKLTASIKKGDVKEVTELINQGADVNHTITHTPDTLTPLIFAVMHDQPDIVQLLLAKGANPNFVSGHNIKMPGVGLKKDVKAIDYLYTTPTTAKNALQKIKIKNLLQEAMKK